MDNTPAPRKDYPFEFTGNASEYFRIWIVNILLTIITLGIYSAWAKVRNHQYFCGNTLVDGSSFEYTASPMQILKGRLLAAALVIAYQVSGYMSATAGLVALGIVLLLMPALVVMALRFRMRYTSWRNIKFGFQPDFKTAYLLFGVPLLVLVALFAALGAFGLLPTTQTTAAATPTELDTVALLWFSAPLLLFAVAYPAWQKMYYRFVANRVQFGRAAFSFIATTMEFYSIYIIAGLVMIGSVLLAGVFVGVVSAIGLPKALASLLGVAVFVLPVIIANAYIQTQRTNIIYSNLELGRIGFRSQMKVSRMVYLYFTNSIAIVLSLGMMIPWAMVRMARYRAETMTLHASDLDSFQAAAAADMNARGEEISDMFDIDIGV